MSTPTVGELCTKLNYLFNWERFAIYLPGIAQVDIEVIKKDNQMNEQQKLALFYKWLRICPEASWEHVIVALEQINEKALAAEIRRGLGLEGQPHQPNPGTGSQPTVESHVDQLGVFSLRNSATSTGTTSNIGSISTSSEYSAFSSYEAYLIDSIADHPHCIVPLSHRLKGITLDVYTFQSITNDPLGVNEKARKIVNSASVEIKSDPSLFQSFVDKLKEVELFRDAKALEDRLNDRTTSVAGTARKRIHTPQAQGLEETDFQVENPPMQDRSDSHQKTPPTKGDAGKLNVTLSRSPAVSGKLEDFCNLRSYVQECLSKPLCICICMSLFIIVVIIFSCFLLWYFYYNRK